jgi:hypothetical protein
MRNVYYEKNREMGFGNEMRDFLCQTAFVQLESRGVEKKLGLNKQGKLKGR